MTKLEQSVVEYREKGFSRIKSLVSESEVAEINNNIAKFIEKRSVGVFYEDSSADVRAIYGAHLTNQFFQKLVRKPDFIELAMRILDEEVYVHQFKVNLKRKTVGECWPWHQDFIYWKEADNIEKPNLVNIAIALDEHNLNNGPIRFIPYSHLNGELDSETTATDNNWKPYVSKALKYQISKMEVDRLINKYGCQEMLAKQGDVFLFDPLVIHGSDENKSFQNRAVLIISYNAVSNKPIEPFNRPEYFCSRDFQPLPLVKA